MSARGLAQRAEVLLGWTFDEWQLALLDRLYPTDSGPATPSPVAGPVIHTTPTENRESA